MKAVVFAFAGFALCAPAAAQVYRCTDASGRVVVQQAPCASGGETVGQEMKRREDERRAKARADSERFEKEEKDRQALRDQIAQRDRARKQRLAAAGVNCPAEMPAEPVIGMKEVAFLDCTLLGSLGHEGVNETQTAAGTSRQYVFKPNYSGGPRYVYTRGGVVTAIQR